MKNAKKTIALLMTLATLLCLMAGCGSSSAPAPTAAPQPAATEAVNPVLDLLVNKDTLLVAMSPDYAPWEYVDVAKVGQAQFMGFDVSVAKFIADELGVRLEIVPLSFEACQAKLSEGLVDMVISSCVYTDERAEKYSLSDFYGPDNSGSQTLLTLASSGDAFADPTAVEGLKVGVENASLQQQLVAAQLPNAEAVNFVDFAEGIALLKSGAIDCLAVATSNGTVLTRADEELALVDFLFELTEGETKQVVMLQKGADELTKLVNEALGKAAAEGKYQPWYNEAESQADRYVEVKYDDSGRAIQ